MTSRPSARTSGPGGLDERDAAAISPPATAAVTKSMATNNRPLPRNTVAKKRSSRWPIRSRSTPTNHRKAMPANGMSDSATFTAVRRPGSVSQLPATRGSAGIESLSSTSAAIRNTEKTIPATAAAPGCSQRATGLQRTLNHIFLGHRPPLPPVFGPRRLFTGRAPSAQELRKPGLSQRQATLAPVHPGPDWAFPPVLNPSGAAARPHPPQRVTGGDHVKPGTGRCPCFRSSARPGELTRVSCTPFGKVGSFFGGRVRRGGGVA